MKILQVGKYYYPSHGGIETVVKNLSEGLTIAGHTVTVLCFSETHQSSEKVLNKVRVVKSSTIVKWLSQPISFSLIKDFFREAKSHDIIHIHSPNPLVEFLLLFLPKNKPFFVTYHSDVIRQRALVPLYRFLISAVLKRAKKIFVSTPELLQYSTVLPKFQSKCVITPFGMNESDYVLNPPSLKKLEELHTTQSPYFLFVGRLVSYKGVDVLLKALQNTNIFLKILGDGPLRDDLKKLAINLGVQSQVEFLGPIQHHQEFLTYLHGSQALVLPSRTTNEAFGMVLIEAMACGKPVVSTNLRSGVRFVNQDGVSGLQVEPEDIDHLRSAIVTLSTNSSLREKLSLGAKQRFKEVFSLKNMINSHLTNYEK